MGVSTSVKTMSQTRHYTVWMRLFLVCLKESATSWATTAHTLGTPNIAPSTARATTCSLDGRRGEPRTGRWRGSSRLTLLMVGMTSLTTTTGIIKICRPWKIQIYHILLSWNKIFNFWNKNSILCRCRHIFTAIERFKIKLFTRATRPTRVWIRPHTSAKRSRS